MSAREAIVEQTDGEIRAAPNSALPRLLPGEILLPLARLVVVLSCAAAFLGATPFGLLAAGVFFVCLQRAFGVTGGALGTATAAATAAVPALGVLLLVAARPGSPSGESAALLGVAVALVVALPPVEHLARRIIPRRRVLADRNAAPSHNDGSPTRWGRRGSASELAKRVFDVGVATAGLACTLPLWVSLALLSAARRESLLHRQLRVGRDGQHFTMVKLRTMRADAEQPGEEIWAQVGDPRVTTVGRFLRESHLDELPQLWNVLRGEMAIVGPRPERPELDRALGREIPHWRRRHAVKPGITGWAQVRLGYAGDRDGCEAKLAHDLWYLEHRSVLLDLAICVRTVATLVPRRRFR